FCMGGQLALFAATKNRRIAAVVDCYGIHPNVALELAPLAAPVMGIFAERDAFVPPAAARKLEAELRAAGKRTDFTIFPGVDHAFLNDTRADVYAAAAAERAWGMMVAFLRAELVA
ncbi:MAG: dienelactone hydrolase family protein, partial [Myxococcota bacterium]